MTESVNGVVYKICLCVGGVGERKGETWRRVFRSGARREEAPELFDDGAVLLREHPAERTVELPHALRRQTLTQTPVQLQKKCWVAGDPLSLHRT